MDEWIDRWIEEWIKRKTKKQGRWEGRKEEAGGLITGKGSFEFFLPFGPCNTRSLKF